MTFCKYGMRKLPLLRTTLPDIQSILAGVGLRPQRPRVKGDVESAERQGFCRCNAIGDSLPVHILWTYAPMHASLTEISPTHPQFAA